VEPLLTTSIRHQRTWVLGDRRRYADKMWEILGAKKSMQPGKWDGGIATPATTATVTATMAVRVL
jgi:hypothetical protein